MQGPVPSPGEDQNSPLLAADRALHLAQGLLAEQPTPFVDFVDCDDPCQMDDLPQRATFDPYLSQQPSLQPLFHEASSALP